MNDNSIADGKKCTDGHIQGLPSTFQSEGPVASSPNLDQTEKACVSDEKRVKDSLPLSQASFNHYHGTQNVVIEPGHTKLDKYSDKTRGPELEKQLVTENNLTGMLNKDTCMSNTDINTVEKPTESRNQKDEINKGDSSMGEEQNIPIYSDISKIITGSGRENVGIASALMTPECIPDGDNKAVSNSSNIDQKSPAIYSQIRHITAQETNINANNASVTVSCNEKGEGKLRMESTQPDSVQNISESKGRMVTSTERLELFTDFSSQSDSDTDGGDRLWIAEAMDTDESAEIADAKSTAVKNSPSSRQPVQSLKPSNLSIEKKQKETSPSVTTNVSNSVDVLKTDSETLGNSDLLENTTTVCKISSNDISDPITKTTQKNGITSTEPSLESTNVVSKVGIAEPADTSSTKPNCEDLPKEKTIVNSDTVSGSVNLNKTQECSTLNDVPQSKHSSISADSSNPVLQDLMDDVSRNIKKEPEDYHEFDTAITKDHSNDTGSQSLSNINQKTPSLSNQLLAPPRPISLLQNVANSQPVPAVSTSAVKQSGKAQPLAYLVPVSSVRTQPVKAVTKVSFANREKTQSTKVSHTMASLPRSQGSKLVSKIGPVTSSAINIQSVGLQKITELIARKNQIPNYKPPPAPSKFFQSQPSECYHVCYECGDTFYLEKSLLYHKNRMSMRIKYKCEMCHSDVFFYNKCMFLSHLRNHLKIHKSQAVPIHIKSDSISISLVKENVFSSRQSSLPPEPVGEMYNLDKSKDPPVMAKNSTNDKNASGKGSLCHMCCAHFINDSALAAHYGRDEGICKFNNFCGFCHCYLPSSCALKAHRNLHTDSTLLVCPDCGLSMLPEDHQKFYHHLTEICFHFCRFITFNCSKCNVTLDSSATLKDHLLSNVNQYFKCKSCPMAFKTLLSFKNHFSDAHDEEMKGTVTRVVFRCHVCDCVMDNRTVLEIHIGVHMTEAKKGVEFKFRCPYCGQVFNKHAKLSEHVCKLRAHSNMMKCHKCQILFSTKKELVHHHLNNHNTLKESQKIQSCKKCGFLYLEKDFHCGHQTNNDCCNFIYKCTICSNVNFKTCKLLVAHLKKHQDQGILVCHKCGSNKFSYEEEFHKHVQSCTKTMNMIDDSEDTLKKVDYITDKDNLHANSDQKSSPLYPCHLCALTYENNSSLNRHIKIVHEGKRHVYPCYICRKKNQKKCFSKRTLLERHLASRHHLSRNQWDESQITREYPDSEEIQFPSDCTSGVQKRKTASKDVDSPVKRLRVEGESKFVCAKCEFSCPEKEKFLDHIIDHNMKNSVQCLECGLCFAVMPSLRKHLFIVHKVKDFEQYCEDNAVVMKEREENCFTVSSTSEEDENAEVDVESNPLACHICSLSFDSEMACKTHMRTHGMAFLRAKRKEAKVKVTSPSGPKASPPPTETME
ncbi:hypothetical protein ScPMuIL_018043 [Solemya velum]